MSHQEPPKAQLGAKKSCFCFCFAIVTLICQQPAMVPQFNSFLFQLGRGDGVAKAPVFLCMPQTYNLFKGALWKFIMWYFYISAQSSYLDHSTFESRDYLIYFGVTRI